VNVRVLVQQIVVQLVSVVVVGHDLDPIRVRIVIWNLKLTVKISLFKLSKFPFSNCQNFPFQNDIFRRIVKKNFT
jgi:hypothetical protein